MQRSLALITLTVFLQPLATPARPRTGSHSAATTSSVIRLHDGRNTIDLLGTGDSGVVDVADRENFNAHGSHVAIFQLRAHTIPRDLSSAVEWQVLPFFGGIADSVTGTEVFRTVEGADCTLRDLRIVRSNPKQPVEIVVAERELGASFADPAPVEFHYYELRTNTDGVVGWPAYYFAHTRVVRARQRYCDVDDAFDRELHLGRAGMLKWEGPA